MNKSTNILFMIILIVSIIISISSNSWFIVWMGMEINMMAFLPMMIEQKNIMSKESSLTYFMTQTIASMLLLMSIMTINKTMIFMEMKVSELMMLSSLMMKSGISPFHFWMPKVMEGLNWNMCLILMTWQKITPLMMMSNLMKVNMITITGMTLSIIVGAVGGLNQMSLRKLMAYSSISNNGWMLMAMMISETMWLMFFFMYMIMMTIMTMTMKNHKNYHINQITSMNETTTKKFMLMLNMLSISGLPPMLGFMPKWMIIQSMMTMKELMLMSIMIIMTLITVYYYLRIMFPVMLLTNPEPSWNNPYNKINNIPMMLSVMSIMGLTTITLFMFLY
uniref:NADH-ubiquinone oxidoreductase chain 2 n=1 Tax=Heteropteryx dilatata TaxID=173795 RepID=E2RV09_HETDI|nr:NADH dehydrogenase subunit 2 [Heteropteryx dilatata]BAJ24543.1 NADH dehydrogenase subunit 2 [Heteropteryx dilatata]